MAVSPRPPLLLGESTLTAWPLSWGVPKGVRGGWLLGSPSWGSLVGPSSWVWIRAAGKEAVSSELGGGGRGEA